MLSAIKNAAIAGLGKLLQAWPVNRIVVVLTPTVFMPLSAWAAAKVPVWLSNVLPGSVIHLSQAQIEHLMLVGAAGALAKALMFLRGWQKHEERAQTQTGAQA